MCVPKRPLSKKTLTPAIYDTSAYSSRTSHTSRSRISTSELSSRVSQRSEGDYEVVRKPLIQMRRVSLKMSNTQTTTTGSNFLPTDTASDGTGVTDDTSKSTEVTNCECAEHKGQLMIDSTYPMSANQLFKFLFTDNQLIKDFHTSVKRTDMNYCEWMETEEKSRGRRKHKRTSTYTVGLANSWGPKSTDVTEEQELIEIGKQPADGYVVRKNAVNAGVPYADSFNIYCTYCITQLSATTCRMRVHAGLEFKKSVMGMIKGYIERSTMSGMQDYYTKLDAYVHTNASNILKAFADQRLSAGADFSRGLSPSIRNGSFRSLTESNGYDSDIDERRQAATKKKRVSYTLARTNSSNAAEQTQQSSVERSLLVDINYSLRLIAFILILLLLTQLWSIYALNGATSREPPTGSVLSRLVRHERDESALESVQKVLADIQQRLSQ